LIDFINRDAALITPEDYRVTREEIRSAFKFYADSYATV